MNLICYIYIYMDMRRARERREDGKFRRWAVSFNKLNASELRRCHQVCACIPHVILVCMYVCVRVVNVYSQLLAVLYDIVLCCVRNWTEWSATYKSLRSTHSHICSSILHTSVSVSAIRCCTAMFIFLFFCCCSVAHSTSRATFHKSTISPN